MTRRWTRASSVARLRCFALTWVARSRRVRAGEVTGMRSCSVRSVGWRSDDAVNLDLGGSSRVSVGRRHVHRLPCGRAEAPQNGGGVVAEQRAVAESEHRRHRLGQRRAERSDEIHAPVPAPSHPIEHPLPHLVTAHARGHRAAESRPPRAAAGRGPGSADHRPFFPLDPRQNDRWEERGAGRPFLPRRARADASTWEERVAPSEPPSLTRRRSPAPSADSSQSRHRDLTNHGPPRPLPPRHAALDHVPHLRSAASLQQARADRRALA